MISNWPSLIWLNMGQLNLNNPTLDNSTCKAPRHPVLELLESAAGPSGCWRGDSGIHSDTSIPWAPEHPHTWGCPLREGTWDWLRNSSGLNLFTRRRYETSATPCFDLFLSLTLSRRYVVYVLGTHFRTGNLSGFTYGSLHQPKRTLSGQLTSDPHIHCLHLFASLPAKCPSFSC